MSYYMSTISVYIAIVNILYDILNVNEYVTSDALWISNTGYRKWRHLYTLLGLVRQKVFVDILADPPVPLHRPAFDEEFQLRKLFRDFGNEGAVGVGGG